MDDDDEYDDEYDDDAQCHLCAERTARGDASAMGMRGAMGRETVTSPPRIEAEIDETTPVP